jgi:RND superfamily putative drug exporter
MAALLYRLGRTGYRRWPYFIAGWLVAMVAVGTFAATSSEPLTDDFTVPGIASQDAADLQAGLFPGSVSAFDRADVNVIVAAPQGHRLDEPAYRTAVDDMVRRLAEVPQVPAEPAPADPVDAAAGDPLLAPLSDDGRIGIISLTLDVDTVADVEPETREAILDVVADARGSGLVAEVNGSGMQSKEIGGSAELIGIAVALLVLVLTFGALVTAGVPVVTAIWGVGLSLTAVTAMTAFTDVSSSTTILASMIGLAVGIDYALFILSRYRSELTRTGDRVEAVGIAVGTAGSAVVFAGLTVIIALSALAVVRMPFLTAMGLAAAFTVLVAVAVALTLLPAVLGMLGGKAFAGRVREHRPRRDRGGLVLNNGVRWARAVGRHPIAVALFVTVGLAVLAVPMKDLHLAFPTDSTDSSDTTQRKASDLVTEGFGPGREAPMAIVVDGRSLPEAQRPAAYDEIARWAGEQDDVESAILLGTNADGSGAQVLVTPRTGPDEVETEDLLDSLRDAEDGIEQRTGTVVGVTGLTAINADVSTRLSAALPVYLAVVIGLAFVLLMIVFRSILVPLTATLGFLLSVLATLGVTVAIFQEGGLGLLEGQPIVSFMPIILIGLVFGLAMDYQVFLVTRMREAHVHGMATRDAVVDGFRNSARVVSAAAVIMISVFAAFILTDDPVGRSMGFALATAVFLDAFVVRMALIPALMYLLGERAWWLPAWLDRLLPDVDVEGASLERLRSSATPVESDEDELVKA